MPTVYPFLLRAWRRSGDAALLGMVEKSLVAMRNGGIYDQQIPNYATGVAVQALAATKDPKYKDALAKARGFLIGAQLDDKEGKGPADPSYGGLDYGGTGRGADQDAAEGRGRERNHDETGAIQFHLWSPSKVGGGAVPGCTRRALMSVEAIFTRRNPKDSR